MSFIPLLIISIILIILFVPVTPLRIRNYVSGTSNEGFMDEYDDNAPPDRLIMNSQKEAEELHQRDVIGRVQTFFTPKLPQEE